AAATLAGEHAGQAGVERWAAVDERWEAVSARNAAIGAKDDTIAERVQVEQIRDATEGFRNQAGQHSADAGAHAAESQHYAGVSADFTNTTRDYRDQAEAARDIAVANGLTWRGTWASGTAYAPQDVVTYQGGSWRALQPSSGVTPSAGATWAILAARGEPGESGTANVTWGDVTGRPSTFPPETHNHTDMTQLGSSGTRSASTFMNGLGNWVTPYTVMSESEATTGSATTARVVSASGLKGAIQRWATGTYSTAITAIGQALNRAATAAEARAAIGALGGPGSVGTAEIADGAVTTDKLGGLSVSSQKIQNSAINHTKIANNAVIRDKLSPALRDELDGLEPRGWDGTQEDYDNLPDIDPDRSYYIWE
ncbi:hypothetical protein G6026_07425, partial [Dietzia sp. DQ11-38-2]